MGRAQGCSAGTGADVLTLSPCSSFGHLCGVVPTLSGGRGALDWKSDVGLRFPRAGILAEEQAGWSSAVLEAVVETVVGTCWILTLLWALY